MPNLHPVALDLAETIWSSKVLAALAEAGHFDVVINNAGGGHFGPAATIPTEDWRSNFKLSCSRKSSFAGSRFRRCGTRRRIDHQCFVPRLAPAGANMAAYNAAKAAMASFTMTLNSSGADRLFTWSICNRATSARPLMIRSRNPTANVPPAQAWAVAEKNMKSAPPPELVARRISALIDQANPPPRVTVGDPFQTMVAPLIFKLIPQRVRLWGLKKYYRL